MKLETLVANKDLSKELYDLGVRVESVFWWGNFSVGWELVHGDNAEKYGEFPALTTGELGKKLGKAGQEYLMEAYCEVMDVSPLYTSRNTFFVAHLLMTEPDIAAKMLIYLIKNNLITIEEINKQV